MASRLIRAEQEGFLVCRKQDVASRNAWYRWCESRGWPYVCLFQGRTRCEVEIDLIAEPWELSDAAMDEIDSAFKASAFDRRCYIGRVCCYASTMPLDQATALAMLLVDVAIRCKPGPDATCDHDGCSGRRLIAVSGGFRCDLHGPR